MFPPHVGVGGGGTGGAWSPPGQEFNGGGGGLVPPPDWHLIACRYRQLVPPPKKLLTPTYGSHSPFQRIPTTLQHFLTLNISVLINFYWKQKKKWVNTEKTETVERHVCSSGNSTMFLLFSSEISSIFSLIPFASYFDELLFDTSKMCLTDFLKNYIQLFKWNEKWNIEIPQTKKFIR